MSAIRFESNHILTDVQTNKGKKTCVVDTGAPLTFFYDKVKEYAIDGTTHGITYLGNIAKFAAPSRESVEKLIGTKIDGFIGSDVMRRCGNILIDFRTRDICFPPSPPPLWRAMPMENLMGVPLFNASFNGHETRAAFDTGAMYSFVSRQFAQEIGLAPSYSTFTDYHPGHGSFEAELHRGVVAIGGMDIGTHNIATAPYYDTVLSLMKVEAFLGIDTLRDNCAILLSYIDGKVYIK